MGLYPSIHAQLKGPVPKEEKQCPPTQEEVLSIDDEEDVIALKRSFFRPPDYTVRIFIPMALIIAFFITLSALSVLSRHHTATEKFVVVNVMIVFDYSLFGLNTMHFYNKCNEMEYHWSIWYHAVLPVVILTRSLFLANFFYSRHFLTPDVIVHLFIQSVLSIAFTVYAIYQCERLYHRVVSLSKKIRKAAQSVA